MRSVTACAVVVSALASSVHANVVLKIWGSLDNYDYKIIHMPDLDQRRDALPNDGAMYCVPTATFNLMGYAAKHGFPTVYPGPTNWKLQSNYVQADDMLEMMGLAMNTDAVNGTGGVGWHDGSDAWLDLTGAREYLTTHHYYANGPFAPQDSLLAAAGVTGHIVCFAYGRYQVMGTNPAGGLYIQRLGGHALTLTGAQAIAGNRSVTYRDSTGDADLLTQSPFTSNSAHVIPVKIAWGVSYIWMSSLTWASGSGDDLIRLIDGVVTLKPKYGVSWVNTATFPEAQILSPFTFTDSATPVLQQPSIGEARSVIGDMQIHPNDDALLFVDEDEGGKVKLFDMKTSAVSDALPGNGFKKIAVSHRRKLYATDGQKIYCYDVDTWALEATSSIGTSAISALTFDDDAEQVVGLSIAMKKISKWPASLAGGPTVMNLPSIPMSGDGAITASPHDDKVWFVTSASNNAYGAEPGPNGPMVETLTSPAIVNPMGIDFDDAGHLFIATNGSVVEFMHFWNPAFWQQVPSYFAGLPANGKFLVSRSRSNFDPQTNSGPGWENLDPSEVLSGRDIPDCDTDLDGNDVTDAADLALLLGSWGNPNSTLADVNADGVIDAADLGLMLGAWGPCP